MSDSIEIPKPTLFPYFKDHCNFCTNPIYIPGDNHMTCANCKKRLCNRCGLENQKLFGNKYYVACSSLCNKCWSCSSDNESSSSESSSDESSGYESVESDD